MYLRAENDFLNGSDNFGLHTRGIHNCRFYISYWNSKKPRFEIIRTVILHLVVSKFFVMAIFSEIYTTHSNSKRMEKNYWRILESICVEICGVLFLCMSNIHVYKLN